MGLWPLLIFAAAASTGSSTVGWERHEFAVDGNVPTVTVFAPQPDGSKEIFAAGARTWRIAGNKVAEMLPPEQSGFLHSTAIDMDHDGDLDLAVARFRSPWVDYRRATAEGKTWAPPKVADFTLAWLENPGGAGEWPLHPLDTEINECHGLGAFDGDGDGHPDLVANSVGRSPFADHLLWYRTPVDPNAPNVDRQVASTKATGRSHYFTSARLSPDGPSEILLTAPSAGLVRAWTPSAKGEWLSRVVARKPGVTHAEPADVNGDGRPDLVISCGHGTGVSWLEGPGWTEHVIDGEIRDAHALAVADFNRDGRPDVAAVSYSEKVVFWYENTGAGTFQKHALFPEYPQEAYEMRAEDVDGDGGVDLVIAGRNSRNVVWLRNLLGDDSSQPTSP